MAQVIRSLYSRFSRGFNTESTGASGIGQGIQGTCAQEIVSGCHRESTGSGEYRVNGGGGKQEEQRKRSQQ